MSTLLCNPWSCLCALPYPLPLRTGQEGRRRGGEEEEEERVARGSQEVANGSPGQLASLSFPLGRFTPSPVIVSCLLASLDSSLQGDVWEEPLRSLRDAAVSGGGLTT
ncbi:hypothetical protein E2C01_093280 [Portunus trituberculatus]|uniref:Uncharacterized protein n=1 Tax=Portunus trituberculatus TaxID=210409 RepID=A0A5B7K032_PORTR|nr:hypothetical protein [Portunus trituberculatus]